MRLIVIALFANCSFSLSAQSWSRKADLSGPSRIKAVAFSIGNKGYTCTGQVGYSPYLKDLWEYDPFTNVWTRKADLPGTARTGAIAFSIGNKGYVGLGDDNIGSYEKDIWEYNPLTDSWTRKNDFTGPGRRFAVAFSIGNKGYVGTGDTGSGFTKEFWEYDQASDTWTQRSAFPGTGREYAAGFAINGRGYIGAGTPSTPVNDFWEYNPSSNNWTRKADFPGSNPEGTSALTIENYGYMGTGNDWVTFEKKFWRYNPFADLWTQIPDFGGTGREHAVGFTICGRGYVGAGGQEASPMFKDVWEYTPEDYIPGSCCTRPTADFASPTTIFCSTACVSFSDSSINNPTSWLWTFTGANPSSSILQNPANICYSVPGFYDVSLIVSNNGCSDTIIKQNYISVNDSCNFFAVSDTLVCTGNCVTFSAAIPASATGLEWSFPGGIPSTSSGNPVTVCYFQSGVFDATLIYKNVVQDTISRKSILSVINPSTISVTASDTIVERGSAVDLNASTNGTISWSSNNNLSCGDCLNPTAFVNETTTFVATTTNQYGCMNSDSITIEVIANKCESAILLPSAFSPNGDGHNEYIRAYSSTTVSDFNLKIFNRWGEKVFEINNPEMVWDGTYKGVMQDIQVFAYIIQYSCKGEKIFKTGNITLIR